MGVHLWDKHNKLRVPGSTIVDIFQPNRTRYSMASGLWHVKKKSVSTAGTVVALHSTYTFSLASCRIMLPVSPSTVQMLGVCALGSLRVGTGHAVS